MKRLACLLLMAAALALSADAAPKNLKRLEREIQRVRQKFRGEMAVYVKNLATGEEVALDADRVYETFSVIKVPIMAEVLRHVLYHGKPRLDGASGFTSNRYTAFRRDMRAFPELEALRRAYEMGARRLIVHYGDYSPGLGEELRQRVEEGKYLREVAVFGQDVVYEFVESGRHDGGKVSSEFKP